MSTELLACGAAANQGSLPEEKRGPLHQLLHTHMHHLDAWSQRRLTLCSIPWGFGN